ncbi:hypothetical protein D3C71_1485310 [compost metagenome]
MIVLVLGWILIPNWIESNLLRIDREEHVDARVCGNLFCHLRKQFWTQIVLGLVVENGIIVHHDPEIILGFVEQLKSDVPCGCQLHWWTIIIGKTFMSREVIIQIIVHRYYGDWNTSVIEPPLDLSFGNCGT